MQGKKRSNNGYDARKATSGTSPSAVTANNPLTEEHYRTHNPKHPDCEVCRHAKPQMKPHKRKSDRKGKAGGSQEKDLDEHRPAKVFGDLITADPNAHKDTHGTDKE